MLAARWFINKPVLYTNLRKLNGDCSSQISEDLIFVCFHFDQLINWHLDIPLAPFLSKLLAYTFVRQVHTIKFNKNILSSWHHHKILIILNYLNPLRLAGNKKRSPLLGYRKATLCHFILSLYMKLWFT